MSEYYFEQLKNILGDRFTEFKNAYDNKPRFKALRVNTLKISVDEFKSLCDKYERDGVREYGLKPNPLCEQSFYTCVKPSLDPLYHAGLYYMQEPSASAAVAALKPYIGTRALDLCAAPGGKTTQGAAYMNGGVLFCNDVESKRVRALKDNIARLGVTNAVVTQASAGDYVDAGFEGYFDTLIVDAPCSGGGMMRYETVPYSESIVEGCAARQREILRRAVKLLRRGGYMLYSTCTFAPQENEENVGYLLDNGFKTVDIPLLAGVERGIDLPNARRIYPHNFDGEGHFYCVLQKTTGGEYDKPTERVKSKTVDINGLKLDCAVFGDGLHVAPEIPKLDNLYKKLRGVGVVVGEPRSGRSYDLLHALNGEQLEAFGTVELAMSDAERYIRGEQLDIKVDKGYYATTIDGFAIGLVKSAPDGAGELALKNYYPQILRV